MTSRKNYVYTTGTLPATPVTNLAYTYDSSWKDLLTKIGTASVTSDASGNILTDGTHTFTWTRGSLLASMTKSGQTAQYTYDIGGIRTRKVCGGVTTDYTYAGSLLLAEKRGTAWQRYFYDAGGILAAITYGGATYYYVRDGLMNITDLIDSNGNSVVHYTYDAWGKILAVTGSMASTLGHDNPFRYKGYYYDEESGLYYLISRYYDPETGRFISMDALQVLTMTPMEMVNKNLYVYCDGNPVIRIDITGNVWETVFDVLSLGFSIAEVAANPYDPWNWAGLVGDTIDLIPFVTGTGEVVKGLRFIDKAGNTFEIAKAVDLTEDAKDKIKGLERVGVFTKSNKLDGTKIHTGFKNGKGFNPFYKEYRKTNGIRPDYYDKGRRIIYELKPFNPKAAKHGIKQLQKYNNRLGGKNIMRLEFY